jgi:hypothetical protein
MLDMNKTRDARLYKLRSEIPTKSVTNWLSLFTG